MTAKPKRSEEELIGDACVIALREANRPLSVLSLRARCDADTSVIFRACANHPDIQGQRDPAHGFTMFWLKERPWPT